MYAQIDQGEIVGITRNPNGSSSTPIDQDSAEYKTYLLRSERQRVRGEIIDAALARTSALIPPLDNRGMIDLLAEIWPGLDKSTLGPDINSCKDIITYARAKISQISSATVAQLAAYDAESDPGWPI